VAQLDERYVNRTASVLSGMTDTEYSATTGSNKVSILWLKKCF